MNNFDVDSYMDRQLDKHLAQQEMDEVVSNCCGEPIEEDTDICSGCGEHCSEQAMGEYMYDMREAYECDQADAQRELDMEREYDE